MGTRKQAGLFLIGAIALLPCCGGDDIGPAPDTISQGPVTITSDPLTIDVGPLHFEQFVEIATTPLFEDSHYYDPRDRGDDTLTWTAPARATGVDGDGWLVLEGGAKLMLAPGDDDDHARLVIDASAVSNAVLTRVVLPIAGDEQIHGFVESYGGADASGQVREAQFRVDTESESGLNEAHAPVPLAMWPRQGVGLFVHDRRTGAFDLGAARPGEALVTFGLPARGPLPIDLFVEDTPVDLVRRYVSLTALPAVPPRWAFAPQQWRNVHDSSDEVRDDANAMRTLGIPGSVMWIDNPWQTGYNTFVFDEQRFVGIDQLLSELESLGYRVVVWSTPYLQNEGETQPDYRAAREAGYFVEDGSGVTLDFPWKEGPVGLIDFTDPDATTFWQERIARVVDRGISGFKLDYGEDVVPELGGTQLAMSLAAGDNQDLHGIFNRYYHEAYLEALPDDDGFLITRAGAWGEQDRNTCIWPGDLDNDMSIGGVDNGEGAINVGGLRAAIAGGLSLSVSGYPFFGSDIGGYRGGEPDTETLIRWSQYAALGTIMQLGGSGESHNPWDTTLYDAPALEVYQEYSRLHMDLNPYLWTLALQAGADGTPVTTPCRFAFPDAGCDDAMFLLGDAILVAPVVEPGATTREVTLPPGEWVDWWTGEAVFGTFTADAPLTRMPIYRRVGAFVPMFARAADTLEPATAAGVTSYADPAYGSELRLLLTGDGAAITLHDGAQATAPDDHTLTFTAGDQYTIATFDLIGTTRTSVPSLSAAADEAALMSCAAPGCYLAEAGRLRVRVHGTNAIELL